MKTHPKSVPGKAQSGNNQRRRGVALLTVLTIVSLCTILILTFFQLAQNEMVASDSYNSGLEAQQVAEEAVNLVIRQIRVATAGNTRSWASQPGAIRTWDTTGQFDGGYKLYSDDQMVEGNEDFLVQEDSADFSDWDDEPWRFVDLNEPVVRGDKVYYPIVDPTAREIPEWPQSLGSDNNGIEGFFLYPQDDGKEGLIFNSAIPVSPGPMREALQDVRSTDGIPRETLPMPVMWLYQLKDGSLGTLDQSGSFVPTPGGSNPTERNPIVARLAFWTDDETSKLNPNVHAGGASWATPMAGGDIDRNLGRFQPAQHEWQRYPGHPATTHIAPVLAPGIPDITYQRDNMELIFGLVPRIVGGGSLSGTAKVNTNDPQEQNGLIPDKDRLYASLDEFLLEPGSKGRPDLREPNEFPDPANMFGGVQDSKLMQEHIERSKFFLSVVSRAPEVTVFNTPRVSIWPTHYDGAPFHSDDHHTEFDTLIRFCGEVGSRGGGDRYEYHFQRFNSDSSSADYTNIGRNRQLLSYLDRLTSERVPGYGMSFRDKYGNLERHQILTEIFDYIRCANLHDDSLYGSGWSNAFTGANQNTSNHLPYTNGRLNDNNQRGTHKGHGQVTPIQLSLGTGQTKGFGRFYTLSEMGVVVIACADAGNPNPGSGSNAHPVLGEARMYNPGMREYQRGMIEDPSPRWMYSNLPPIPATAQRNNPNPAVWPAWLMNLIDPNSPTGQVKGLPGFEGEDLLDVAFNEENWNWQLAWLDSGYRSAMPGGKYNRGLVSTAASDNMHLQGNQRCVQAALVWNMFCPSLGWVPINPDMLVDIAIDGMRFDSLDGPVEWGLGRVPSTLTSAPSDTAWASNRQQVTYHDRHYGGNKPFTYFATASGDLINGNFGGIGLPHRNTFYNSGIGGVGSNGRATPVDLGYDDVEQYNQYTWITRPFKIGTRLEMESGKVAVKIWSAGSDTVNRTERSAPQTPAELVQSIELNFPDFSVLPPEIASGRAGYINEFGGLQHGKTTPMEYWSLSRDGANPIVATRGRFSKVNGHQGGMFGDTDVVQSVAVRHGDMRVAAAKINIAANSDLYLPHEFYGKQRMAHGFTTTPGWRYAGSDRTSKDRWLVPSSEMDYHQNKTPYLMPVDKSDIVQLYGDFDNGMGNSIDGPYINKPDEGNIHSLHNRTDPGATGLGLWEMARDYGDFPYFVRDWIHEAGTPSYFSPNRIISSPGQFGSLPVGTTEASNTGDGIPWRTLLFRPNVEGGIYTSHPGSDENGSKLPDHLFLDLFWMPVVEPYAISEPLSTAGKVNLNYQILPFHHIKRNTALRGVFKSEYMLCIPNDHTEDYKIGVGRGRGYHWRDNPYNGSLQVKSLRTVILEDHTLYQFEEKFSRNKIFKTASEICDIHLIPQEISKRMGFGGSRASIRTTDFSRIPPAQAVDKMANGEYWSDHAAVGDNSRERPYSNIYARITTKSNTFKVHYRAQVVKKAKGSDPGRWEPLLDQVVAEYRGSSIVERYVEPNDPEIPDYATDTSGGEPTIDQFYKFRVVNPTRFAP